MATDQSLSAAQVSGKIISYAIKSLRCTWTSSKSVHLKGDPLCPLTVFTFTHMYLDSQHLDNLEHYPANTVITLQCGYVQPKF